MKIVKNRDISPQIT